MVLDEAALASFKRHLLELQQELTSLEKTGADAAQTVELDQTRVGRLSRMDALQGQAMSREMGRRRQIELQKIAAALRRLEKGEFGYCVRCEEAIALQRLEHDPGASLCIRCASESETQAG